MAQVMVECYHVLHEPRAPFARFHEDVHNRFWGLVGFVDAQQAGESVEVHLVCLPVMVVVVVVFAVFGEQVWYPVTGVDDAADERARADARQADGEQHVVRAHEASSLLGSARYRSMSS